MRFLLINTNPAVSKLVNASLSRIGHAATEIGDYNGLSLDTYVLVIVDSDSYKPEYKDDLLSVSLAPSLMYLKAQDDIVPQGVAYVLKKPFLPTDFIALLISILYKTPELKRFITPEVEQFRASLLKDYTQSEIAKTAPLIQPTVADTTNKTPIFDIKESVPSPVASKKADIFTNLSDELSKLYENIENTKEELLASVPAIEIDDMPKRKQNDVKPAVSEEIRLDEFMFGLKNASEEEARPRPAQEFSKPTTINKTDGKIDFDFDIFDNLDEKIAKEEQESAKGAEVKDTPPEIRDETPPKRADFGFGDLAKEFDDLLQADKDAQSKESVEIADDIEKNAEAADDEQQSIEINDDERSEEVTEISIEDVPQAPNEEIKEFDEGLGDLSERDMESALQSGGMLPQPSEIEVVKTEIENVVGHSVKGVLQSQVLREVLKGLKMNITITFEDK
jgi:uncharacterized membrane protein